MSTLPASPASPEALRAPRGSSSLFGALQRMVEPSLRLPEPMGRLSRLLAWLIVSLLPLMGAALVLLFVFNEEGSTRRSNYAGLIVGLTAGLASAFALNRAGRYQAAAGTTVICAVAAPWGSLALDPMVLDGDFVPLVYVVFPVLICGILLSARVTAVLAAVQIGALCVLPLLTTATASINWPSLVIFVAFVSVLSVVANVIRRMEQEQIDRQTDQLTERQAELHEQTVRDPLTGLFNRRYLEETLEREFLRAEHKRCPLGVIMLDIDHFKRFNDTHGHAAGDELLREVGRLLLTKLRKSDIACRYGGEEFTLILPDAPLEVVLLRAEQLCAAVRSLQVQFDGRPLSQVTVSFGVAAYPEHGSTGAAILAAGDAALYRAKRDGRDRVALAMDCGRPGPHAPRKMTCHEMPKKA